MLLGDPSTACRALGKIKVFKLYQNIKTQHKNTIIYMSVYEEYNQQHVGGGGKEG